MKKSFIFLLFLPFVVFGQRFDYETIQNNYGSSLDVVFTNSTMLNRNFFGLNVDYKFFYHPKTATGLSFNIATRGVSEDFMFAGIRSEVTSFDIGWIHHYDFVQAKHFRMGVNIIGGYSGVILSDRNEMEVVWTEFGTESRPKRIARNGFLNIQPGFETAIKIAATSKPDVYLIFKVKHRQLQGATRFGSLDDFSGMFYGFGVMLSGF
jgi:hypothetical protein